MTARAKFQTTAPSSLAEAGNKAMIGRKNYTEKSARPRYSKPKMKRRG